MSMTLYYIQSFFKVRFKSKKPIVPQIITPKDNITDINQLFPQLTIALHKQAIATANAA